MRYSPSRATRYALTLAFFLFLDSFLALELCVTKVEASSTLLLRNIEGLLGKDKRLRALLRVSKEMLRPKVPKRITAKRSLRAGQPLAKAANTASCCLELDLDNTSIGDEPSSATGALEAFLVDNEGAEVKEAALRSSLVRVQRSFLQASVGAADSSSKS